MTPTRYLAGIAGARALYIWLYEDAAGRLPPPVDGAEHDIASYTPLRGIAQALGIGMSTVRADLAQLVSWGWVRDRKMPRFLGRRVGATVCLLADLEGERHTGHSDVVSRGVLHLETPAQVPARKEGAPNMRGTNRRWEGVDDTWGKGRK